MLLAICAVSVAVCLTWVLCRWLGRPDSQTPNLFPKAFAVSSILLFAGSYSLHQAIRFVKLEKQQKFRAWLVAAMLAGTTFMGVQSYALWSMFPSERAMDEATRGVLSFVICFAALHALHFLVAVLCIAFIIARTWGNRYDHEYHFGVTLCAWFWHGLGIVWVAILGVIVIAI